VSRRRNWDAAILAELRSTSLSVSHRRKVLSFDEFDRFVRYTRRLLGEVSYAATGSYGDWVITDLTFGSATLFTAPADLNGRAEYVENIVVSGLHQVEEGSAKPPFFSESALRYARILATLAADDGIELSLPSREPIQLTRKAAGNVTDLLAPRKHYFGSVTGNLDVVSVHRGKRITVYSDSGDVARCHLPDELLPDAVEYLGQRVVVTGEVAANRLGQIVSVKADGFFRAPARVDKQVSAFFGAIPALTDGLPIPLYLDAGWATEG
jgi:hypothetical protein